MFRAAGSRSKSLKYYVGDTGPFTVATRFSSTSVVKRSSGGFLSWLIGGKSSQIPSLDLPLPGVTSPPPLPDYVDPGKTKITTLPNGIRIASEPSANPIASIGLYVKSGSIYETPVSFGATHLLERMAFKTTTNRSHLRLVREIQAIGAEPSVVAAREHMGYCIDGLKSYVPEMVEVLIDSVRNPAFLDWEVNEQLQKVEAEVREVADDPQGMLIEAIHSTGYAGALAIPLVASGSGTNRLNGTLLEAYVAENYTAPRMVLAASGVEHEELVSYAEPLLSDLPKVPCPVEPKSIYVGGDSRVFSDSQKAHVALAFEVPGGWQQEKEASIAIVLQMLMGGGGTFWTGGPGTGGPGKGKCSRLYLQVLNQYEYIECFSAFNSIYNNTGIFGIFATTGSNLVSQAVDLAVRELQSVATPGQVDQKELDRAKAVAKSAVLMNIEIRGTASEDIGRQILTYGERKPVERFLKFVDEVSLDDIASFSQRIISTPLTMASWGEILDAPTYDSVSRKFRND